MCQGTRDMFTSAVLFRCFGSAADRRSIRNFRLNVAEELWATLRLRGLTQFAPTFVTCRVLAVPEIPLRADLLFGAGVPSWAIELAARGPEPNTAGTAASWPPERSGRPDLPRAPTIRRASMQAALEAARPEHRAKALASERKPKGLGPTVPGQTNLLHSFPSYAVPPDGLVGPLRSLSFLLYVELSIMNYPRNVISTKVG